MQRSLKVVILTVVGLYLIVQLLAFSLQKGEKKGFFVRTIFAVTSPLQRGVDGIITGVGGLVHHYFFLVHTSKENKKLQKQVDKLQFEIRKLKEIESENHRLRELLELESGEDLKLLVAQRLASGASSYEKTTRVKRGTRDGVMKGMAVVHTRGVVGQVLEVYEDTADVLLLTDAASAIDSIDQRSRARGILRGSTFQELRFEFVPNGEDIQVGDEIVSSGLDGVYPKGIPIGTVSFVEKGGNRLFLSALVKPHVDFTRLEEVAVVLEPKGAALRP